MQEGWVDREALRDVCLVKAYAYPGSMQAEESEWQESSCFNCSQIMSLLTSSRAHDFIERKAWSILTVSCLMNTRVYLKNTFYFAGYNVSVSSQFVWFYVASSFSPLGACNMVRSPHTYVRLGRNYSGSSIGKLLLLLTSRNLRWGVPSAWFLHPI